MAARKPRKSIEAQPGQTITVTAAAPAAEPTGEVELPPDQYAALDAALADLAGSSNAQFSVYRYKKNQPLAFLFKCPPESFSLDELRDKYNGGDFSLYIVKDGTMWKRLTVTVEPPVKPHASFDTAPAAADMVIAMREGFREQTQMVRDLMMSSRQPAIDIPQLLTAAGSLFGAMRQAANPPAPPPTVAAPPPPSPTASLDGMLDLLKKGIDLGQKTAGAAEVAGDANALGLIRELVKQFGPAVMEAAQRQQAQPASIQKVFPNPQPPTPPPPAAVVAVPQAAPVDFRQAIAYLLTRAKAASNPGTYADWILDNFPQGQVHAFMVQSDAIEQLIAFAPEVATYRPWFENLQGAVLEMLSSEGAGHTGLTAAGAGANGGADAARPGAPDPAGPPT
jgi:hypothetical protein